MTNYIISMEDKKMLKCVINICLVAVFCSRAIGAHASDFLLESEINARITYDDNVSNTVVNEESSSIYTITPKIKLNYHSDNWESAMNAHVAATSYSDKYKDHLDGHLDFETAYKNNRSIYSIMGGYDKYSNLAAEDNLIGLSTEQIDTEKLTLAPEYTHLLTERASISLAYSYSDVTQSKNLGQYLPYETQSAIGEVGYKLSQKSDLSLVLMAMDYTSENNIVDYQFLSSKIGIAHRFSEMITGKLFIGANTTDIATRSSQSFVFFGSTVTGTQAVESSEAGEILEASIDAKWIEVSASRDTVSNSYGGLDQTDKLHTKLRMQVTPLIGITLSLDRVKVDEVNDNVLDYSRTYTKIVPAMNFSVAHNLKLRAEYIFTKSEYNNLSQGQRDRSKFAVNLTYNFPSI